MFPPPRFRGAFRWFRSTLTEMRTLPEKFHIWSRGEERRISIQKKRIEKVENDCGYKHEVMESE